MSHVASSGWRASEQRFVTVDEHPAWAEYRERFAQVYDHSNYGIPRAVRCQMQIRSMQLNFLVSYQAPAEDRQVTS
jgi:hypothetical protein